MFSIASCPVCGDELRRTKRSFLERLGYSAIYSCKKCQHREAIARIDAFKVTRHARCPECENSRLRTLKRRDYIDRLNRNPLRWIQKLAGASLYHCAFCRLQFYDLRPSQESSKARSRKQISAVSSSSE